MKTFDELYIEIENETLKSKPRDLFVDLAKEKNRPLVLYGAGASCEFTMFTCGEKGASVSCVCDSRVSGVYKYKEQTYDIISPEQLLENYFHSFVLITTLQYGQEIYDFLCASGFPNTQIYFFLYPYMMSVQLFREKYLDGYRWAYDFFADEHSKRRILDRIRLYLLGRPCTSDSLSKDGYFAFPYIKLDEREIYIDGGAYTGDTAKEFITNMKDIGKDYGHIYSFEPDSNNCERAVKNLSQYSKIDVIPKGLWSCETELKFINQQGASSRLEQYESTNFTTVPVTSLDTFFAQKPQEQWLTTIKMDIEGAEKEALLGAEKILKTQKPQLVICTYHRPEDIYELPQTIMKIRDDYRFSLWQIGESFWDMILYAI